MLRRSALIVIALFILAGAGYSTAAVVSDTGTNVSCATATATAATPAHTVGVDGTDVHTIPGDTNTQTASHCETQTYVIPTTTVPGPTTTQTVTQTVTATPTSTTTSTTSSASPPPLDVALSGGGSMAAGLPRSDATCAAAVTPTAEIRPVNVTANHTVPAGNGANVTWGTGDDSFALWPAERKFVTGQHKGTTDEIFQYYACKWGFPADLLRADAVNESHWHQADVGDLCGGTGTNGIGSYSILQIKNKNCAGAVVDGGYPDTQTSTPLGVDFTASQDRACYDGAFKGWLYDHLSVSADITAHESYADPVPLTGDKGQDYVLWGCIGHWYSGGWWDSGASSYISSIQGYYKSKPWLQAGF